MIRETPAKKAEDTAAARVVGGSEMAQRIRDFPWEITSVGPMESWSETLLAMVNMMLCTRHPVLLLWGAEMVLLYNDAFRPILTDRHPQALGQRGREFWTDVWPVVGAQLEAVLRDAKDTFHENALVPILRNGAVEDAYFNYSYSPVFDECGTTAGVIVICQDVTLNVTANQARAIAQEALTLRQEELDKSVRALHAERARLLNIVQQAPAFFALLLGPEHVVSMVNPRYLNLVGNRDILGKPLAEALPEVVEQGYVAILDHVVATGQPYAGQGARVDIVRTEGHAPEERIVDFVYEPLREEDGSISGVIVLGVDVTESKQAQKALLQNEKLAAVGRLAASIAHEINNPLESVTNLLYLARNSRSLADIGEYLDVAERELRRMTAITTQTLSFNKQATHPRPVTCADLIGSVLHIYQGRILNSGVAVEQRNRAAGAVTCFDGEIRQVLNNLVSNAIDAMQNAGGRLLLRSREATDWRSGEKGIVLTIADTGCGMEAATLKRIFEPFFTTKGLNGTGLGLWVSRDIVARHKGALRIRSGQRRGHSGTVFTLFLPFHAAGR